MRRYQVVLSAMALGVAVFAGHAVADGPGDSYGAQEVGTIRFIDRRLNLIQLDDGTELRTTDARLLANLHEGMRVKVDFTHSEDKNELNSIEPVGPDTPRGVSPTAIDDSSRHS